MFFLLPAIAAFTVSVGEAIGIGVSVLGIGACVKGCVDYRQAQSIQDAAAAEYRNITEKINRKALEAQNRLESFGLLKLRTYTGVISEAVETLSQFISVDLSAFKDTQVEHIRCFSNELTGLKDSVVKASDVLSCLSVGVATAVNDRFPYKDTPPVFQAIGAFGLKLPANGLPNIPYAAITMAGLHWGISGSAAKTQAETNARYASNEIEKLKASLPGFDALFERIAEGEKLIAALTDKLRLALAVLQPLAATPETTGHIENAVALTRALKELIEVDVCGRNGLLTPASGILFHTIAKEYAHV